MSKRKILTASLSATGILLLILDGKTAVSGASEGLQLCIRSVIPSLFPFFVLSNLLTGTLLGQDISVFRPLGRLFRIPAGAESLLLTGFLGGYPVGAQCIAASWRSGQLSRQDAERMLAFCNNAGPSFLFGIIAPILSTRTAWLLWGIHVFSTLFVSLTIPAAPQRISLKHSQQISITDSLKRALITMSTVCGWVILFRVCIQFLSRWVLWILPPNWSVFFIGLLELANGCLSLTQLPEDLSRILLCAAILGLGGICVTMQTLSVTEGLGTHYYFPGKLMQSAVSVLLICLLFHGRYILIGISLFFIIFSLALLRKMEKRSRNQMALGV